MICSVGLAVSSLFYLLISTMCHLQCSDKWCFGQSMQILFAKNFFLHIELVKYQQKCVLLIKIHRVLYREQTLADTKSCVTAKFLCSSELVCTELAQTEPHTPA